MPQPTFTPGPLAGLMIIQPAVFTDDRGAFFETYNAELFRAHGIDVEFVQDNESISRRGVIRGMHFQTPPYAQAKLVRVTAGAAYDVAVDIRRDSPTYGKSFGVLLNAHNNTIFFIPAGFAHGLLALEDDTHFLYKCSALYAPASEGGLNPLDPALAIAWPLDGMTPMISPRDAQRPSISEFTSPF